MICPVCEHDQLRGASCDVCGHRLHGEGAVEEPVPRLEGLEPTRLGEGADDPVERLAELEPTSVDAGPSPGPRAAPAACPYCHAALPPGEVFCGGCGMRLPRYRPSAPPASTPTATIRCRTCSAAFQGSTCPACGTRAAPGEA